VELYTNEPINQLKNFVLILALLKIVGKLEKRKFSNLVNLIEKELNGLKKEELRWWKYLILANYQKEKDIIGGKEEKLQKIKK